MTRHPFTALVLAVAVGCSSPKHMPAALLVKAPFPEESLGNEPFAFAGTDVYLRQPVRATGANDFPPLADTSTFAFSVAAPSWLHDFDALITGPQGGTLVTQPLTRTWTYTALQLRGWNAPITIEAWGRSTGQAPPQVALDSHNKVQVDAQGQPIILPAHDVATPVRTQRAWAVIDGPPPAPTRPAIKMEPIRDNDTRARFGEGFADYYLPFSATIINPVDKKLLVYINTLRPLAVYVPYDDNGRDWRIVLDEYSHTPEGAVYKDIIARGFFTQRVKPESFGGVLATFESIKRDSQQQVTVDLLKIVGEIAAAVTPFVSGVDYSTGVAAFTGVGIPQAEGFLLRDFGPYTKNVQDLAFVDSVIEIPANSEVTKIVFFARQPSVAMLPGELKARLDVVLADRDISVHSAIVEQESGLTLGARN